MSCTSSDSENAADDDVGGGGDSFDWTKEKEEISAWLSSDRENSQDNERAIIERCDNSKVQKWLEFLDDLHALRRSFEKENKFFFELRELLQKHQSRHVETELRYLKLTKLDDAFGDDGERISDLLDTCRRNSASVLAIRMLENMDRWASQKTLEISERIKRRTHGGTFPSDVHMVAHTMQHRLRYFRAVLSPPDERADSGSRYKILVSGFPLLFRAKGAEADRAWALFTSFYKCSANGATRVLMHSVQSFDEHAFRPMGECGTEDDITTDEAFRKYLNPERWKPAFSAHLSAPSEYDDARHLLKHFDLKHVDDDAASSAIIDVFTLQLLSLYSPQNENVEMPSYEDGVRTLCHTVTNIFRDPRELFRELCMKRVTDRIDFLQSMRHGYRHDADELGLESSETFGRKAFARLNEQTFFDAIQTDYDENRVSDAEEDDAENVDAEKDLDDDDDDDDAQRDDTEMQVDELGKLFMRFRKADNVKVMRNCPPSSVLVVYELPDGENSVDRFMATMRELIELATDETKRREAAKMADLDSSMSALDITIDDKADSSASASASASSSSTPTMADDDES